MSGEDPENTRQPISPGTPRLMNRLLYLKLFDLDNSAGGCELFL